MTPEELAAIRERHERMNTGREWSQCDFCSQAWPCDTARALAHIDALTAAVEELRSRRSRPMTDDKLRAAAQRVCDAVEGQDVSKPVGGDEVRDSLIALRAALASAPDEGPLGTCCENGNFGDGHDCLKSEGRPAAAPALANAAGEPAECRGESVEGTMVHSAHVHATLPRESCFVRNCELPQHRAAEEPAEDEYRRAGEEQQDRDLTAFLAGESGDPPSVPDEGPEYPSGHLDEFGNPAFLPGDVLGAPALDVDIVERVLAERWCGADSHDHEMQSEHREDAEMFVREYAALAPVPDEGPLREAAHKLSWAVLNHLSGHTLEDFAHQLNDVLARPVAAPALDVPQLIADLAQASGYVKAGDAMIRAYHRKAREYAALAAPAPENARPAAAPALCSGCGHEAHDDECMAAPVGEGEPCGCEYRPAAVPALDVPHRGADGVALDEYAAALTKTPDPATLAILRGDA